MGKKHAVLLLHAGVVALMAAMAIANVTGVRVIASAVAVHTLARELLWRSTYWIRWRLRVGPGAPAWTHLYALVPFIGAGGVPIGKSPEYFARYEAGDGAALARNKYA